MKFGFELNQISLPKKKKKKKKGKIKSYLIAVIVEKDMAAAKRTRVAVGEPQRDAL